MILPTSNKDAKSFAAEILVQAHREIHSREVSHHIEEGEKWQQAPNCHLLIELHLGVCQALS
jgi:hypothetical protein